MQIGEFFNPFKLFQGTFIPDPILESRDLSANAKLLYGRLVRHGGDNGDCYPKLSTLGRELGTSISVIRRAVQELVDSKFLVALTPEHQDRWAHKATRYKFVWHPDFETAITRDINGVKIVDDESKDSQCSNRSLGEAGAQCSNPVVASARIEQSIKERESLEREKNKDVCLESKSPDSQAAPLVALLTFPTDGREKEFHLTEQKVSEYNEAFPALDVLAEARKARQWLIDNPSRRKTGKGMPRFLFSWLERSQNNNRSSVGQHQGVSAWEWENSERIRKEVLARAKNGPSENPGSLATKEPIVSSNF